MSVDTGPNPELIRRLDNLMQQSQWWNKLSWSSLKMAEHLVSLLHENGLEMYTLAKWTDQKGKP